jgi:magnesium-protoporphyrin O-methyltransferase
MDSLIHYRAADTVRVLASIASRTRESIVFTFAPRTPLLAVMHSVGRLFPRSDRAPAIEPVSEKALRASLARESELVLWEPRDTRRVERGFYRSQGMLLGRA